MSKNKKSKNNVKNKVSNYKPKFLFLIPVLAVLGLLVTIELIHIYYVANFAPNAAPSFCAINEQIDCDAVARTSFSLFLGVPNAVWGLCFYLFVLLLYYAPKLKNYPMLKFLEVFRRPASYIFCLSVLALMMSVYLAWVSFEVINKICLLCMVTYVIDLGLLLVSKVKVSLVDHIINSIEDLVKGLSNKWYAVSAFLVVLVGLVSLFTINSLEVFTPPKDTALNNMEQFKSNKNPATGNVLGVQGGKVLIEEYTDIQCPHCARSNAMMHKLVKDMDGVEVVHHDFPLDKECNPLLKSDMHVNSCLYARYLHAAKNQNKMWDLATPMFDNNSALTEEKVLEYAKNVGLDVDKLKKDAYSEETVNALKQELEQNIQKGIIATPTYIINGQKQEGIMTYTKLLETVEKLGATPKNAK